MRFMESGTLQRPFGVEGALAKGRPPSPTLAQLVPRVGRESISATLSRNKTRNPLGASGRTFLCPKGATSSSPGLAPLGPTLGTRGDSQQPQRGCGTLLPEVAVRRSPWVITLQNIQRDATPFAAVRVWWRPQPRCGV